AASVVEPSSAQFSAASPNAPTTRRKSPRWSRHTWPHRGQRTRLPSSAGSAGYRDRHKGHFIMADWPVEDAAGSPVGSGMNTSQYGIMMSGRRNPDRAPPNATV